MKKENEKIYQDKYDDKKFIDARNEDIVIAKGGDGTLLKAINKFRYLGKPFFGIAGGTLNFLMNKNNTILKNAKYKKFTLIKVRVTYQDSHKDYIKQKETFYEKTETFEGFNDFALGGDLNSWINFNIHDKDRIIGQCYGSGIIFSTSQGSTGLNKNNGGVILPLSSKQWSITGTQCNRRIHYVIDPNDTTITCNGRSPVTLWVDGGNHIIKNVSKIEISKGSKVTTIFNNYKEFKRKRRL